MSLAGVDVWMECERTMLLPLLLIDKSPTSLTTSLSRTTCDCRRRVVGVCELRSAAAMLRLPRDWQIHADTLLILSWCSCNTFCKHKTTYVHRQPILHAKHTHKPNEDLQRSQQANKAFLAARSKRQAAPNLVRLCGGLALREQLCSTCRQPISYQAQDRILSSSFPLAEVRIS